MRRQRADLRGGRTGTRGRAAGTLERTADQVDRAVTEQPVRMPAELVEAGGERDRAAPVQRVAMSERRTCLVGGPEHDRLAAEHVGRDRLGAGEAGERHRTGQSDAHDHRRSVELQRLHLAHVDATQQYGIASLQAVRGLKANEDRGTLGAERTVRRVDEQRTERQHPGDRQGADDEAARASRGTDHRATSLAGDQFVARL